MKFADAARITIKKLFECACCHTHIESQDVGVVGDSIVVCKECAVKVALYEQELLTTFKMINKGRPMSDEDKSLIRRMSFNIKIDVPAPTFVESEVV